ncbi:MAG: hypothetical protein FOGNACKC_06012 [Anaerolineae bacterium]|nr:hypothetical protein [Anaerolineae bacterium]
MQQQIVAFVGGHPAHHKHVIGLHTIFFLQLLALLLAFWNEAVFVHAGRNYSNVPLQHIVLLLQQAKLRLGSGDDVIAHLVDQKLFVNALLKTIIFLMLIQVRAHILLLPGSQRVRRVDVRNLQLFGYFLAGPTCIPVVGINHIVLGAADARRR